MHCIRSTPHMQLLIAPPLDGARVVDGARSASGDTALLYEREGTTHRAVRLITSRGVSRWGPTHHHVICLAFCGGKGHRTPCLVLGTLYGGVLLYPVQHRTPENDLERKALDDAAAATLSAALELYGDGRFLETLDPQQASKLGMDDLGRCNSLGLEHKRRLCALRKASEWEISRFWSPVTALYGRAHVTALQGDEEGRGGRPHRAGDPRLLPARAPEAPRRCPTAAMSFCKGVFKCLASAERPLGQPPGEAAWPSRGRPSTSAWATTRKRAPRSSRAPAPRLQGRGPRRRPGVLRPGRPPVDVGRPAGGAERRLRGGGAGGGPRLPGRGLARCRHLERRGRGPLERAGPRQERAGPAQPRDEARTVQLRRGRCGGSRAVVLPCSPSLPVKGLASELSQ